MHAVDCIAKGGWGDGLIYWLAYKYEPPATPPSPAAPSTNQTEPYRKYRPPAARPSKATIDDLVSNHFRSDDQPYHILGNELVPYVTNQYDNTGQP